MALSKGVAVPDRAAAAMLQKATCNLQLLDLSWNHLGDSGVAELCQGLKETATLRRLFLSHNNMSSVGCSALASVMHESGGGAADVLEELDVSYNNCRFDGGANALSLTLRHALQYCNTLPQRQWRRGPPFRHLHQQPHSHAQPHQDGSRKRGNFQKAGVSVWRRGATQRHQLAG